MRKRKLKITSALLFLLLAMLACNYVAPTKEVPPSTSLPVTVIVEPTSSSQQNKIPLSEASVPRVSLEEALTALNAGEAVIVDVRSKEAYDASHIAGAISVPLGEIETNLNGLKLDKEQWIITYCT